MPQPNMPPLIHQASTHSATRAVGNASPVHANTAKDASATTPVHVQAALNNKRVKEEHVLTLLLPRSMEGARYVGSCQRKGNRRKRDGFYSEIYQR